jgi:hyperosmotically inducible periplasmic protein
MASATHGANNGSFNDDLEETNMRPNLSVGTLGKGTMIGLFLSVALGLAGCDKYTDSGQTVGQKLDSAIDKTNAKIAAAGDKVEKKVDQAGAAVSNAGESISNATGAVVDKAGTAVFTKVDQVNAIAEDSTITASIKADFLKDPGLSALAIEVNTVKGEVTLKGEVTTEQRKQRAEAIASHIVGVTKVTNLILVRSA